MIVHEHCGEAGAIGAALEAGRLWDNGRVSTFIGLDACARHPVQDHARRSHPLLLLQEQVPAHVHRRQDQPSINGGLQAARPRPRCRWKQARSA